MSDFPWPLLASFTAILVFFGGILVTVISGLLKSNQRHSDRRFEAIEKALDSKAGEMSNLRAALAEHKLHVSEKYVHRDDYVRLEGSKAVLLSNLKEEVGTVKSELTRVSTLLHERLPATQGA